MRDSGADVIDPDLLPYEWTLEVWRRQEAAGLTNPEIAKRAGITGKALSEIDCAGSFRTWPMLAAVARAVGVRAVLRGHRIEGEPAEVLRDEMDRLGLTAFGLGERIGVTHQAILNIISERNKPRLRTLAPLCVELGLSVEFVEGAG